MAMASHSYDNTVTQLQNCVILSSVFQRIIILGKAEKELYTNFSELWWERLENDDVIKRLMKLVERFFKGVASLTL